MLDDKARVLHALLSAHPLKIAFPALAVRRIGEHEIKLAGWKGVVRERRVLRAADDVVGLVAFTLEEQVRLADRVGLGVDLLAVKMGGNLLRMILAERDQGLLGDGQHAASAAGAVVEQVCPGFDLVGDRQKDEFRHKLHGVAGRPVLARLLVVLFVEAAKELLEEGPHRVVVDAGVLH